MRLIGYRDGNSTLIGAVVGPGLAVPVAPADEFWRSDPAGVLAATRIDLSRAHELAPADVRPAVSGSARILCVGLNYPEHAAEGGWTPPPYPTVFGRWAASLSTNDVPVHVPPGEVGLDWEGELAVVVGRDLWQATPGTAMDAVFGYAAFNDLTARRAQKLTTQWTLGKNADHSGPISEIVTADEVPDPTDLALSTSVNGEIVQSARTSDMVFSISDLLVFLSGVLTLHPGDVIATGTPSGVGYVRTPPRFLLPGDVVEVTVEDVGSVRTPVQAFRRHPATSAAAAESLRS